MTNNIQINARELCSRKLWQLISGSDNETISDKDLHAAVTELARRRRYLEELEKMGKLEAKPDR